MFEENNVIKQPQTSILNIINQWNENLSLAKPTDTHKN